MIPDINSLNSLVMRETQKAIKAILESSLSGDDAERHRQDQQKSSVDKRDLKASDEKPTSKEEAEEETEDAKDDKDKKREDRSKGKGTADSPKLKTPKASQLKNPTLAIVADKLNALRGGKSLKDPEVKKSFEQYFDSLTVPEKQSLVIFLTGIAQVLAGKEVGSNALDPSDAGLRVKKTKDTATKAPESEKRRPMQSSGTEENPIVVGEVASKINIIRALKAYKDNT